MKTVPLTSSSKSVEAENVAAAEALGFQGLLYDARKAQPGDLAKARLLKPIDVVGGGGGGKRVKLERFW